MKLLVAWTILLLLTACQHTAHKQKPIGIPFSRIERCVEDQKELYSDICAEGDRCDETNEEFCTDKDAQKQGFATALIMNHYRGLECGVDAVKHCAEAEFRAEEIPTLDYCFDELDDARGGGMFPMPGKSEHESIKDYIKWCMEE